MRRRQPLPRLWLMTDERQGDALWTALDRLPRGAGVVFRHYSMLPPARRALFEQVRQVARRRRLLLVLAGSPRLARAWGADGAHSRAPGQIALRTAPAHNLRELRAAERAGAQLVFISPIFPTHSHPDARTLGSIRFRLLARSTRLPVAALGGLTEVRARSLGARHWGAIDAWTGPVADYRR